MKEPFYQLMQNFKLNFVGSFKLIGAALSCCRYHSHLGPDVESERCLLRRC